MSDRTLKPGWRQVKFGDVVKLNTDKVANPEEEGIERYVGLEHLEPGDLRVRSWGLVEEGTTFTNYFQPGQVLFGKRRAYQRKVAVAEFDGVCSGDIYVFETKDPKVLLPELLPFICQTDAFFDHAVGTSAGSLSPRTNWTSLAKYEFALPGLEEQENLVDVLKASREVVEENGLILESLKTLRQSLIDELCQIERDGRFTCLGDICKMQNGKSFPSKNYQESGVKLLRPGNLATDGYLNWSVDKTIFLPNEYLDEATSYVITCGDILINLTAQSLEDGFMGRVCIARQKDLSLLNQRIGRFHSWRNDVVPKYIYRVLQTSAFQKHAISMCSGTKVKHLYWRHLEVFDLPLPPISEQEKIVEQIDSVDCSLLGSKQKTLSTRFLNSALLNNSLTEGNNV